jgi:hypothetical protein
MFNTELSPQHLPKSKITASHVITLYFYILKYGEAVPIRHDDKYTSKNKGGN